MAENKMQFEIDVRDVASEKIRKLEKRIESLGGQAAVDAVKNLNKLEREAKSLSKAAGEFQNPWTEFTKKIALGNLAAMAAAAAFSHLKTAVINTAKAGMDSERTWNNVRASLQLHGHAIDLNIHKIQRFASEWQSATGIGDEAIAKAVTLFIDYGNSVEKSMKLAKSATDLAVGAQMDLESATRLLTKASVGQTETLSRYGIIIDTTLSKEKQIEDLQRKIDQAFGGRAAAQVETLAGRVELLTQRIGDLQEELGKEQSGGWSWIVDALNSWLGGWTAEQEKLRLIREGLTAETQLLRDNATALDQNFITRMGWNKAIQEGADRLSVTIPKPSFGAEPIPTPDMTMATAGPARTAMDSLGYDQIDLVATMEDQQKKLEQITKEVQQQQNIAFEEYQQRWAFAADAVEGVFQNMAYSLMTDSKNIGDVMKKSFEQAGQSIVASLINKGVTAMLRYMAMQAVMRTGVLALNKAQKAQTIGTAAQAAATSASAASSTAMAGITVSLVVPAMVAEAAAVRAVAAAYVKATVARDAFMLGSTSAASIAGAATTMAGLTAILSAPVGFDDPRNDLVAFKQGRDFARMFMAGQETEWAAPGYGRSVSSALPEWRGPVRGGDNGGPNITIIVQGSLVTEQDLIDNVIIPQTERRIDLKNSRIMQHTETLTGGRA